jgi:NADH dehydrogenase
MERRILMSQKRIVVLGAGYGGILTAKKLANKFKRNSNISVTLIDKNSYHTMLTELHEVAAGRVAEESVRINLKKVFAGRKVDVVLDEIKEVDFNKKQLSGTEKDYAYDYLVIGTGSKPTFFNVKGAEENVLTLWSFEDAVKIKNHILDMMAKASIETDPEERKKLLTFMVIGCGFTGIEMIGELAEWKDKLCHKFSVDPKEVTLYVADMLPKVLPNFEEKLIKKAEKRLRKLGVTILTKSSITEVGEDYVTIEGKENIKTYTTIWAAGIQSSDLVDGLEIEKKGRGRIETDVYLRAKDNKDVFVVGDNIFYIPEGEERPVPQMVENAEHSASLVAKNIQNTIRGKKLKEYKPEFHGAMVCIGGRYGVAQVGMGKTNFLFSGFLAMFIKHFINIVYFVQVAGFAKVWSYLMHEIFHVEDRRSFVGGYLSKRSPNFWLVPLRMFIGVMWFLEGFKKLGSIIKDPTHIFLIPPPITDVSAASETANNTVEAVKALPVPEFIQYIVDWSMNLIFYSPDGGFTTLAVIFQVCMVAAEILIGLSLFGGLFTAISSIASIGLGIMIWSSGMAPFEMLWYVIAGIAMIGGSGSTFGLDYYVLPFLKKQWKKFGFVKKWYLYTDE